MTRTQLLQELRKLRFEEAYGGWQARRLTQEEPRTDPSDRSTSRSLVVTRVSWTTRRSTTRGRRALTRLGGGGSQSTTRALHR